MRIDVSIIFFFSSRRRHTRYWRDWSSDVCSSDLGMSIGIIFSFLTPGFMTDLPSFLFGNILTIGRADLWLLGVLAIGVVAVFVMFYRLIVSVAFDRTFALARRLPVKTTEYVMMEIGRAHV